MAHKKQYVIVHRRGIQRYWGFWSGKDDVYQRDLDAGVAVFTTKEGAKAAWRKANGPVRFYETSVKTMADARALFERQRDDRIERLTPRSLPG